MKTNLASGPEPGLRVGVLARAQSGEPRDALAYAANLTRALHESGVHAHLLADCAPVALPPEVPFHRIVPAPGEAEDVVAAARLFCAAVVPVIGRLGQEYGPFHILHACSWASAPAALSARRHGGARAVVTFLDTVFSRTGHCNGDRLTAHIRNLEQQAAREADLLVAGNEAVRRELAWLYGAEGDRVKRVPADALWTLPAPREPRVPDSPPCVGFAGPWSAEGGSDLFLQAVRALADERPDLRMVVAADGLSPAKLEADLRRRGLSNRLVSGPSGQDPLAACDVVVVPARGPVGQSGVYQARALGVPVVVARTGPVELVEPGRTGSLAFPFADSLVQEVKKWLSGAPRVSPSAAFTWRDAAINLNAYYRAVLARSEGAAESHYDVARAR